LRPLIKLKCLVFLGMTYTDAGLQVIGDLPQLEMLFLTGNEVTDHRAGPSPELDEAQIPDPAEFRHHDN